MDTKDKWYSETQELLKNMTFRYASFNRPLWCGFDPGQQYIIVDILPGDSINGRKPHDVFTTENRISPEKLASLEITSYEDEANRQSLRDYAKTVFAGIYYDTICQQIHNRKITTIQDIKNLVEKYPKYTIKTITA